MSERKSMNIFVLEDVIRQQLHMETVIEKVLNQNNWFCNQLEFFGRGEQLLDHVNEKGSHQLFFLDIEIHQNKIKGLEIAKSIRENDPYATIVFVSNHVELIPLVFKYQIKALDLINKKLAYEEFEERIYATIKHVQNNNNCDLSDECFIFDSKQAHIHIPYYQLLFVDTSGASHNLILHSLYGQIEIKGTLLQVLESEPRLFRCHRLFVINLSNVVSIDKQNRIITFKNGSKCDISRDKVKEVIKGRTYYSCFFQGKDY